MAALPVVTRRVVVYGGDHSERTADGIELLPAESFVRLLESEQVGGASKVGR